MLTGPIRGELLGAEHLGERAAAVARGQRLAPATGRGARLLNRLIETRRILEEAHDRLAAATDRKVDVGPAGEWLLDNFHVVQEHVREVRESLPQGYYRELPELASGPLAGYPRVYELAITLISHTEARIDRENITLFLGAFQRVAPLSIGELWAVPAMLRLGLIESVRRMALRTVQRLDEVELADRWSSRLLAASEEGNRALGAALNDFIGDPPALTPAFIARLLHQLRVAGGEFPPLVWLEQWIAEDGLTAEEADARATQRLALTQLTMANSITSLRAIARMDWRRIVEAESVLEAVLREDPAGVYPRMTFSTRDHYRHVVERVAKRTGRAEATVAQCAVDLARAAAGNGAGSAGERLRHVGYYLVDDGLEELERLTSYRSPLREAMHRWVLRHPNTVFVGGILLVTLIAVWTLFALAGEAARGAWVLVVLVALIPGIDIAVNVINQLVTAFLPPRTLPKLDLRRDGAGMEARGIPAELATAVVMPTLFPSVEAVGDALSAIEVQFLANREPHLHFAILSDFTDAATETRPEDDAILKAAVDGVHELNVRYAAGSTASRQRGTTGPFFLFHRPRRWNPQQGVWMGWERKRGKLAEFNRFIRSGARDAFSAIVGDADAVRRVRYVITLDADTVLPPDTAVLLIGALAHPLNRAVYDASLGRVVRGYGILQPRVGVSLPSAYRSLFAAIHSGHPGVDPYTTAVSDVYQDLYGEGSFTGKGIYDVAAFEEATRGRFPENTLLSHDLIEGNYSRAGLVTDITVYDDYPSRYLSYTRRKHRWIRGDWQLLRWLGRYVPGLNGPERNRLSMLSRWKIFDNLRRSIVEIAQLVLLAAGWTVLPGSPLRWTLLALGAIAAPWILALLLALLRPPFDRSWRAYYASVGRDAITSVQQVSLAVAFLPHQAIISADAIARTLWRLFVSRRKLLEWQPASQTERSLPTDAVGVWRRMWPAVALTIVLGAGTVLYRARLAAIGATAVHFVSTVAVPVLPLLALWMMSPAIAHALSRAPRLRQPLSDDARATVLRYARAHWMFFERFVNAESNWLAPDNFQEDPSPVAAMRTSPTNIGLQLLSTVSAHDLGFISLDEMLRRLELAFRSLERMRRFRGHFFNWYDLHDLRVLEPAYISTVDSGNLAGHLVALRQACLAIDADAEATQRLRALANRAQDFASEMDFRFLFDAGRKLFSIGYQASTHTLDASYYDLLASEARLASFIAIAKDDVPAEHWFHLGRTLTRAAGETALVSWSGSMFEYLMPGLVMHSFPFTVLGETCASAVRRQISYGRERGVPWGVSESAYNLRDRHLTYQYRAFGVPDLALKRGLGRDLVVSPYSAALAALVDPDRAVENLGAHETEGMFGEYGFRESMDFTRPEPGQRFAIVRTFMAHHIGMSLVALTNVLTDGIWPRRFHADPLVRAVELLLHERVPRRVVLQEPQLARADEALPDPDLERPAVREVESLDTPQPQVALLGRLPYTIMVSHCGGGYSRYGDLAVTRWRADGTRDNTGQFCYVKDLTTGRLWSASYQPVCAAADWYRALLATDSVTFHRADGDVETRTEIAVVPQDSAEVRRITLTNNGTEPRELELTSYGEIVLAPPESDRSHPAFSNLFVETEWHEWCTAITAARRPRSAKEPPLWCAHVVDTGADRVGGATCETDRARFLGRGRTAGDPVALDADGPLSGTTGAVLDPVFAIRTRVRLAPGQSASVAFTTLVADTRVRLFELAGRYHDPHAAQRALDLAWTSTQVELRELGISPADAAIFQDLAGHLFYSSPGVRASLDELRDNRGSQSMLWAQGISGDWPIVLATLESSDGLPTLRQLFAAHRYWRRRGMKVDLVVLNAHANSYFQELNDKITSAMFTATDSAVIDQPGGVFVRRLDIIPADQLLMLRATARLHVVCDGGSLARLASDVRGDEVRLELDDEEETTLLRPSGRHTPVAMQRIRVRTPDSAPGVVSGAPARDARRQTGAEAVDGQPSNAAEPTHLQFDNGLGGMAEGGDYVVRVCGDSVPPAPWANVIANPRGGFLVTERGASCTWAESSQFFRLTPWHNDPVTDPVSDVLYLRDEDAGEAWSVTPGPMRRRSPHTIRHGAGSTTFEHEHDGIATQLTLGIPDDTAVKLSLLRVTNTGARTRRLAVTSYVEWTLGGLREHTQHQVQTSFSPDTETIYARNYFNPQYAGWVAFSAMSEPLACFTTDRREFLGRNGSVADPPGLAAELSGAAGAGLDPCATLRCHLELAAGETRELVVVLGAAADEQTAMRTAASYREVERAKAAIARTVEGWRRRLTTISVRTPEPSFDAMINRWSLYQALSCRMWGRTALYQSSGAYGFRDQLQDCMAFVYAEPGIAREHILRAAGRQFVEGDVQHWWHPDSGRGVRTRFSDDLVFLPYVVDHYVRVTGDATVLDEVVPYITMRALEPHEHEVYDLPRESDERSSVYEHCLRALRRACTTGVHGLPLIGIGDWNDGMNRVGVEGRGESVWLAWFLVTTLRAFASYAAGRGDTSVAAELQSRADAYAAAVEAHAWDGAWYRRAYFDDGTPLGSAESEECRIDAIAQSWSVISGAGDPARQTKAMQSFEEHLVREDARLLMLLTPPFDKTPRDPGYIKGYLPGVRENGAQYTHAALWSVLATALQGRGDRAFQLFQMLNPLTHAATPDAVATYKVEPYVVAADVYTATGHLGRGGWTWYTGSASWMYRVGLEAILGFHKRGDALFIQPNAPASWPEYTILYRFGKSTYDITVTRPGDVRGTAVHVTVDGAVQSEARVPLVDDGARHVVHVAPAK